MNTMVYEKIGPDDEYSGIEYGGWGGSYQIGELHLEHFDPEYYRLLFPDPDGAEKINTLLSMWSG